MVENTRVHTKTVTELSQGKHQGRKSRRVRKQAAGAPPIDHRLIDPRIWEEALRLSKERWDEIEGRAAQRRAMGKLRALMEIKSTEEIIIHNGPTWKDR